MTGAIYSLGSLAIVGGCVWVGATVENGFFAFLLALILAVSLAGLFGSIAGALEASDDQK